MAAPYWRATIPSREEEKRRHLLLNIVVLASSIVLFEEEEEEKPKRKKPRCWVRPILRRRDEDGHFARLFQELKDDREWFFSFVRMSPDRFAHLLSLVEPKLKTRTCRSRKPISKENRLVVTLSFLASGSSATSERFNFRISAPSLSRIFREVCGALWEALNESYLKQPSKREHWAAIAQGFEDEWDFPHALGAVDGKHVEIQCPPGEGSNCFNYQKYHSIVLMAMCDARYQFTFVDIGAYGHENDAAIFSSSNLYKRFDEGREDLPPPEDVNGHMLPFTLLGDDIFTLKPWLMKPYPGRYLSAEKKIFNYRLSRARRTIENAFGILRTRWRVFRGPIHAKLDLANGIVQACVCLHNYLLLTDTARYIPSGFVDSYSSSGDLVRGTWRAEAPDDVGASALRPLQQHQGSPNYAYDARTTRDNFRNYFNSSEGSSTVTWQLDHVNATSR